MSEKKRMFERRTVQRERVEVLIAYDTGGDETWVDLQDWLDTVMVLPDGPDLGLTLAEYKERHAPRPHSDPEA